MFSMKQATKTLVNELGIKFKNRYNIDSGVVEDIIMLINLFSNSVNHDNKIKFKYTDDEYGEYAKKLHMESPLKRAYEGDAGIDLPIVLSADDQKHGHKKVWPNEREMLHTGIIMEFPIGYYGRIIHRSSTEKVHRLRVIEGVIDDYRGEILVQVHNQNTACVDVYHGARIGQLVLARTFPFEIIESDNLRPSQRGANGFGSSGK